MSLPGLPQWLERAGTSHLRLLRDRAICFAENAVASLFEDE